MVMVLLVLYWKFGNDEIVVYYCVIGDVIGILIMLYNNLVMSGVDMLFELIVMICWIVDNVMMVKESIGDIGWMYWFV